MSPKEDLDERLPEELSDCERLLVSLAPRASRIDRDRLMIRLGEQHVPSSATPWKWATAASLILAVVLGVRPLIPAASDATEIAAQEQESPLQPVEAKAGQLQEASEVEPSGDDRPFRDEADWLMALASGRFDSSRPLSVRPGLETASRDGDGRSADDASSAGPPAREPTLRWGDERLRRGSL